MMTGCEGEADLAVSQDCLATRGCAVHSNSVPRAGQDEREASLGSSWDYLAEEILID